jgi:hypothetical protein
MTHFTTIQIINTTIISALEKIKGIKFIKGTIPVGQTTDYLQATTLTFQYENVGTFTVSRLAEQVTDAYDISSPIVGNAYINIRTSVRQALQTCEERVQFILDREYLALRICRPTELEEYRLESNGGKVFIYIVGKDYTVLCNEDVNCAVVSVSIQAKKEEIQFDFDTRAKSLSKEWELLKAKRAKEFR